MLRARKLGFGDFEIDLVAGVLRRGDTEVAVEPQVFDLICFFAANSGRLLSHQDLIDEVWSGRIVSDAAISTRISAARKALGDNGNEQKVIKTVPKRGFRFLPNTSVIEPGTATTVALQTELPPAPDGRPSIAIMPFESPGDDPEARLLAAGLRIDIQNALVKVSGVFLSAVGSANAVSAEPPERAASTLGVHHLLQAQVRRAGTKVRFSVQLTKPSSRRIVWTGQYDRDLADSFTLLDEVTQRVLTALNVQLVAGEPAKVWHKTLRDLGSLQIFYRGISSFFRMQQEEMVNARHDFEVIADRHPTLALGPTWVSLTHWYDLQRGWTASASETQNQAREWAERAAEMQDADGQACTVLSHVHLLERNYDAAMRAGAEAVRNRPNCTHANGFYANVLHHCGDQSSALKHIRLAMRHSPMHPALFKVILASVLRAQGDLGAADQALTAALISNPDDIDALALAAAVSVRSGGERAASEYAARIRQFEPSFSTTEYVKRQTYRDEAFTNELSDDLLAAGLPS